MKSIHPLPTKMSSSMLSREGAKAQQSHKPALVQPVSRLPVSAQAQEAAAEGRSGAGRDARPRAPSPRCTSPEVQCYQASEA